MAIPVKVSDDLLAAARATAEKANRSVTKQIEYWAELGRAIETLVTPPDQFVLRDAATDRGHGRETAAVRAVLGRLVTALAERSERAPALARIRGTGKPVYGAAPGSTDRVVQVWPDGRKVTGRFIGEEFVPGSKPRR
jgi:ParD-like antitoxin of type II bacterial toxin-antitoxin system